MEKLSLLRKMGIVLALSLAAAISSHAQTFATVASFDLANGANPQSALVQGTDGNLYGTTSGGGANQGCGSAYGCGTVFNITPTGTLTTLYSFCSQPSCADGYSPAAGLIQGSDGNFYGTTPSGGGSSNGTVFMITSTGTLTTLYSFSGPDGARPYSGSLVQGIDGNFYGTTAAGGANGNYGTAFMMAPTGTLTTLYSFCSQPSCTDGNAPFGGLIQGTDGNFYGTTLYGGANGGGTVFMMTTSGTLTTLYSFCSQPSCTDGDGPYAGVIQGTDGNFYGTTDFGGTSDDGTVFEISAGGGLTTLYDFGGDDGQYPQELIQASDSNFYGTTNAGGANGDGTAFMISSSGALTTLYNFCSQPSCTDGAGPYAGLVQATNGNFYGTTFSGGSSSDCYTEGCGTLFSLSVGLAPFVETQLPSGEVGANISILGTGLKGTTNVSFNGTAAEFTAKNAEIRAKVPAASTTGTVTVTTANGGKLQTNVPFRIRPLIRSFSPKKGPAGKQVEITGVSLAQTTGVSFGGVAAIQFEIDSNTEVTATVPTGATTGTIAVTTSGGTATSKKSFTITK